MTTINKRSTPAQEHKLQVLAVGDCNTYGIQEPPIGNTILDKFCRCLEQAGYPASSQNLGFGMGTSREGIALMEAKAARADILLLNFGLVDSWITSIPRVYVPYFPDSRAKKVRRKLLKFTKRRLRAPLLRRVIPSGNVVPLAEFRANIEQIISLARQANPSVWVLLWGSPPVQYDAERNGHLLQYNAELHDVATRKRAMYLPTKPIIDNLPSAEAFLDNVHLNEAATTSIAAEMAHAFLSQRQRTAA
ncbi:SGNH/GDSL hydrolase family protein [Bythopirellula polymerisocia]|uniref:SGNH hydrolase-type esterase domain-containing protein n=1 Tax=Bythopirellula polymerisocia TaxID=2528003 RepID=A0A5C6CWR7_9BACT|nr:SGNH/GDSL hydrolase family protein [Bythopirellula polymerisocia]TWU28174.1 hypothetical protein Pla144_14610 [Bythopirellula polymerisocia]